MRKFSQIILQIFSSFFILLTVHISIFISVINQLDAQNFVYIKFISCPYMFRAPCTHHQEFKIVLYSLLYNHTEKSEWSKITKIQLHKFFNFTAICSYL